MSPFQGVHVIEPERKKDKRTVPLSSGCGKFFPRLINDTIRTGPWSTNTELEQYTSAEIENGYVVAKSIDERYKSICEKDEFKDINRAWLTEQYEEFITFFEDYAGFSSSLLAQYMRDYISVFQSFSSSSNDNTTEITEKENEVYNAIFSIRSLLESIENQRAELQQAVRDRQTGAQ